LNTKIVASNKIAPVLIVYFCFMKTHNLLEI